MDNKNNNQKTHKKRGHARRRRSIASLRERGLDLFSYIYKALREKEKIDYTRIYIESREQF